MVVFFLICFRTSPINTVSLEKTKLVVGHCPVSLMLSLLRCFKESLIDVEMQYISLHNTEEVMEMLKSLNSCNALENIALLDIHIPEYDFRFVTQHTTKLTHFLQSFVCGNIVVFCGG